MIAGARERGRHEAREGNCGNIRARVAGAGGTVICTLRAGQGLPRLRQDRETLRPLQRCCLSGSPAQNAQEIKRQRVFWAAVFPSKQGHGDFGEEEALGA